MNSYFLRCFWISLLILAASCYSEDIPRPPDLTVCVGTDLLVSAITQSTTGCGKTDGIITASATGGSGTYTFSKDAGKTKQASGTFTGLSGGTYLIIVYDGNLCSDSTEATITNAGSNFLVNMESVTPDTGCTTDNGTAKLSVSGATGAVSYTLGTTTNSTGMFSGLKAGTYTGSATDANCSVSTSVSIASEISTSYVTEIAPIVQAKCNSNDCHGNNNPRNLPAFTTYSVVYNYRADIRTRILNNSMPKPPKPDLTTQELNLIVCWIDAGSQNN